MEKCDFTKESLYHILGQDDSTKVCCVKRQVKAVEATSCLLYTSIINKALEAGIPVVCVNCDAPSSGRLSYQGRDDVEAGREVAKYIVEKLTEKYGEPKGKILMTTTGAGNNWSDQREAGNREIFEQYPDIEIVDFINATGDEQLSLIHIL